VRDARLNITALVIAASVQRFERAASEIRKSDIRSTVWIPAVFLNETNYTLCGGGGNGLRHAMRNAWTLIASTGVAMAVFEDDVAYAGSGHNESVSNFVVTSCLESNQRCDLAYLGEWNNFFTTHAIFILPHTAQWLLDLTDSCYPFGVQIDQGMHSRCVHRPGKPRWNCIHPPPFRIPGTFGQGFFVQDRRNVPSSLHSAGNRPIAWRVRARLRWSPLSSVRTIRLLLLQICLLAGRVNRRGRLGRGEGSPGELGTRARYARSRHQPEDTVGSAHPKGGERARPV